MGLIIRNILPEDYKMFRTASSLGFGLNWDAEKLEPPMPDLDRAIAAYDDSNIVGTAHAFTTKMNIPGGILNCAAVDYVAVLPTHRRRGTLTKLMKEQLADIYERGETIAALHTSESLIYGRFGYGIGTYDENWEIDTRHSDYKRSIDYDGSFEFENPSLVKESMPSIYETSMRNRPGSILPTSDRWERMAVDTKVSNGNLQQYFHVKYLSLGKHKGYVRYSIAKDVVTVVELMASNLQAHAALWRFCFDIDLIWKVKASRRPTDDPLLFMLTDPRRLTRNVKDSLWIRLIDVQKALESRSYNVTGTLVFKINDAFCSWNDEVFELEIQSGGVHCSVSKKSPDLVVDVSDFASTYLGTIGFSKLKNSGRLEEHTQGSVKLADQMFNSELSPWCPYSF